MANTIIFDTHEILQLKSEKGDFVPTKLMELSLRNVKLCKCRL